MSLPSESPRPSFATARKPTLEELLRIKRAERPDVAFWDDFERGLRHKQLAAGIEPRPWWLGFSLFARRLAPLGLPASAGAAALLAVMIVRTQSPLGDQSGPVIFGTSVSTHTASRAVGPTAPASLASSPISQSTRAPTSASTEDSALHAVSPLQPRAASVAAYSTVAQAAAPQSDSSALPVVATLLALPAESDTTPTASQLTIAQNLATVSNEQPGLVEIANAVAPQVQASSFAESSDADTDRALNPRHARLLAMSDDAVSPRGDLAGVRERMVHRLAHDETVYGSASRLAAAGDRFSLSF